RGHGVVRPPELAPARPGVGRGGTTCRGRCGGGASSRRAGEGHVRGPEARRRTRHDRRRPRHRVDAALEPGRVAMSRPRFLVGLAAGLLGVLALVPSPGLAATPASALTPMARTLPNGLRVVVFPRPG